MMEEKTKKGERMALPNEVKLADEDTVITDPKTDEPIEDEDEDAEDDEDE